MNISPGPELSGELPSTGERRRSRERALGLLYEAETKQQTPKEILGALINPPEPYAKKLLNDVQAHSVQIDELLVANAQSWALDRMPAVDRAILRMSTCELIENDVPAAVVIDEAVELAKDYSTEDSGRYVNGVLSAIAATLRPDEVASK